MNLNDFVVVPNNKASSVKLNARNMQDLQMQTTTLAQGSEEMEEKLQQLKERMSKEKEERGNSAGIRWRSGQCSSLNNKNNATTSKENRFQKLSAGKVKMRVLKDEPLTVPPQPPIPSQPRTIGVDSTRKNRLRGRFCGQCEVRTAGLMCAECTEDYCIGCFTKFHQKGALKFHRIIPIQTDLRTHVSTRDVVSCFQTHINPDCCPGAATYPTASHQSNNNPDHTLTYNALTTQGDQCSGKGTEAGAKPVQLYYQSQVLLANCEEEKKATMEERPENDHQKEWADSLLRGVYNEEESARSFQEALKQWREEKSDAGKATAEEAMWMTVPQVSMSATATQTDLAADRGTKGRGKGEGAASVPVRVEFTENGLTYLDRMLLKKHRRTPVETCCPPSASGSDSARTNTEEETTNSLTAEEEDFRSYFASLFAVPVSRCKTEPLITTPEPCFIIEVLNEGDVDKEGAFDPKLRCPTGQQVLNNESTKVTQTARASSSKNKPSSCPTAATPRTSKKSIKTPTSKSQKPYCSPTVHKSKPDRGSQQLLSSLSFPNCQTEIPKSSHFSVASLPDVSPLASNTPPTVPKEPPVLSPPKPFSLRSTYTLSPSSSTETTWLPRVYQLTTLQNDSGSEQSKPSQLFPEPISSVRLPQSPQSNLQPQRQSQHSLCDPEILLSLNELVLAPSPVSPSLRPLEQCPASRTREYSDHRSIPTNEDAPVLMSFTPRARDHESGISQKDTPSIQSTSSHHVEAIQSSSLAVSMEEEEEELSIDSGNEMSSDSLGLAPHEGDSSDEEAHMHRHLMRERCGEEERENPAVSHLNDALVDAEKEELQSDEQEQLPEPCMVMHRQSIGSGSEQSCDLDVFLPLGLDLNSGQSNAPEHSHCASLHTSQTSLHDPELTGSGNFEPSSSLTPHTEEHLLIRLMKDNHTQPTGIKIHSTTPTRRGEISATELGTSGSRLNQAQRCTPTYPSRTKSRASPLNHLSFSPALHPLSRAAQEILEICDVDKTGCEDPDLDTDALYNLEEELRPLIKGAESARDKRKRRQLHRETD